MVIASAIRLPGKINTFPVGEQESSALVAVPTAVLYQLLGEIQEFKAKVASLEHRLATLSRDFREARAQYHKETLFLREKITSQNAKIATLEAVVASLDKKIIVLGTINDKDIERIALEAAYDRQRLAKVETHLTKIQNQNVKYENDCHSPPALIRTRAHICRSQACTDHQEIVCKRSTC
jgi:chromosome segregation ATPase